MPAILLNPGPVTLSQGVRAAMLNPDLCHREPEFAELQHAIREKLLQVYELGGTHWAVGLLTGSGTAAVEAMISSLVPENGKLLSIENGVYGERISRIAEHYRIPLAVANFAWTEAIDCEQVSRQLSEDRTITHVAAIHHETTTGRLNELAKLLKICEEHKVELLLDAVSSFGAEEIPFGHERLTACAATANKCLHGVPGTAFVITRRAALTRAQPRSHYLDLGAYIKHQDNDGPPFTQSVQTFYALNAALDELLESGGQGNRLALYQHRMKKVRDALEAMKIEALLPLSACSAVLHAYNLPSNLTYTALHDQLKEAGFVIYAGQGEFAKNLFRISMMGEITERDIERLIAAFGQAFDKLS
ncbi:MAG: 2-aminoethylphosphonate aminotransferase [Pseudomonadota bacterium]